LSVENGTGLGQALAEKFGRAVNGGRGSGEGPFFACCCRWPWLNLYRPQEQSIIQTLTRRTADPARVAQRQIAAPLGRWPLDPAHCGRSSLGARRWRGIPPNKSCKPCRSSCAVSCILVACAGTSRGGHSDNALQAHVRRLGASSAIPSSTMPLFYRSFRVTENDGRLGFSACVP
jgi:hypothetical protein